MEIRKKILAKTAKFALRHPKGVKKALKIMPKPVKARIIKHGAKKLGKLAGKKVIAVAIPVFIEGSIAWAVKKTRRNID